MRVWERGIGETWACGTGACAVAAAAVRSGLADMDTDISLRLIGGELVIRYDKDGIWMTGDAQKDFEGDIEI
jgi:carbamoyl-phosphate synthase large subunit